MTFSKEIIEIFDYIGEKFGIAIDWSNANVIPYLQELCGKYISYEIATSIMWIAVAVLLALASIPFYKWGKKFWLKYKEEGTYSGYDFPCIFAYAFTVIFIIASVIITINNVEDILRCVFLPELQIYEYISGLINTQ